MMPDVEHSCCGGNVEAPNKAMLMESAVLRKLDQCQRASIIAAVGMQMPRKRLQLAEDAVLGKALICL